MRSLKWYMLCIFLSVLIIPLVFSTFLKNNSSYIAPNPKMQDVFDMQITLYRTSSNTVETLSCYDYICGVVTGEMPASYNIEALKAQTVAAFTYMINKIEYQKANPDADLGHNGAYMCDDYNHCKAYLPYVEAVKKWGESYKNMYTQIENAVSASLGKVITYNGRPINAVFHSISGGKTCNAYEIWGSDIEYLKSVDSECDKTADGYKSQVTLSCAEFSNIFYEQLGIILPTDSSDWIGDITRFDSGTVDKILIFGTEYSGTYIRKLFSLRSSNFEITRGDDSIVFTVYGYGHGVGMSQNGANEMAKTGKEYTEILKHYYTGVKIEDYKIQNNV